MTFYLAGLTKTLHAEGKKPVKPKIQNMTRTCADCSRLVSQGKYCLYHLVDAKGKTRY